MTLMADRRGVMYFNRFRKAHAPEFREWWDLHRPEVEQVVGHPVRFPGELL